MKQLEVQIMGQSYLLGCPEGGETRLLDAVERTGRTAEVTVKVDTGLNRNGVSPADYPAVLAELQRQLQPGAVGLQRTDMAAECIGRTQAGQAVERLQHRRGGGVGQHILARFGQRIGGVVVVHQLEMG